MATRACSIAKACLLLAVWLLVRPTVYGPLTGTEALNSGIVITIADRVCFGYELVGDPGPFTDTCS